MCVFCGVPLLGSNKIQNDASFGLTCKFLVSAFILLPFIATSDMGVDASEDIPLIVLCNDSVVNIIMPG
jgi:hypothetical protein